MAFPEISVLSGTEIVGQLLDVSRDCERQSCALIGPGTQSDPYPLVSIFAILFDLYNGLSVEDE